MSSVLIAFFGLIAGAAAVWFADLMKISGERDKLVLESEKLTQEAKFKAEHFLTEARLKSQEENQALREKSEAEVSARRLQEEREAERRYAAQEAKLRAEADTLDRQSAEISTAREVVAQEKHSIQELELRLKSELERIGELSKEKAREQLLRHVEDELELDLAKRIREYEGKFKEESKRRAVNILALAVHRCAVDYTTEALVTVVPLPTDEMKGRIIGREGRNIRAFESLTGVNVIVDDTPEAVVLSAFNPIKREIARMAMERMVIDGRIHPAKIEQIYEQCQKELYEHIREVGEDSIVKLELTGIHDKLIFDAGKMKFRYSYGQNLLEHSFEVARIATTIAAEMGVDVPLAKRSAFLHDIGKVADSDLEGPHALVGGEMAERVGEKHKVVNAIAAHHEEVEQESVEATIVQVADTLSAGRPGARRNTLDSYIKRLEHMESIAREFRGVVHAYAIQAGREIRVLVRPAEVDDTMCIKLARDIVKKIESSMEYPGQVKVVVTRETRAVDIAK